MNIFDYKNYKKYINDRIENMPKRGHGQYRKLSHFLSVNSVNVSQIFRGDRDLTIEQACELCEYFGLSDLEGQYFLGMVEYNRAGTHKLKKMIMKRLEEISEKSQDLKSRLKHEKYLSEEAKSTFYSNWYYSGIRLLSGVNGYNDVDRISEYFGLSLVTVRRVVDFLLQYGLCVDRDGKIAMGPSSTHLEASSPLVGRHHMNWRLLGIENMEGIDSSELFFTMPCSLDSKNLKLIRKELVDVIERITKLIDDAPSEELACLNIDLFKF
ncbi:MAG: hypothetical protein A4S09_16175 [Proteobacteria bacterium SG_bin7]|nr:MAG: hypothetical protein A4S09_16175 [Proteobacteria bacterium SG_bin7]